MHAQQICKNCEQKYEGHYCPNCGQSSHEGRINAAYFLHDIPHSIFHVDKGFFYTLISLFTRPGKMLKEYLDGKRVKYFRPFAYVILMSTICTLLVKWLKAGMEWIYHHYNPGLEVPKPPEGFFNHYFSVFIFIMIPIASLVTFLFFRKKRYNFWEHFLVNTYIAAQLNIMQVLIYLVAFIVVLFTHRFNNLNFEAFIPFFMCGFLYIYGWVFGFLMSGGYKTGRLVLGLTLMNCILFFVYVSGFQLTGLMNPW